MGATAHKISHTVVTEKPEITFKCLKGLVDLGRFELPTPWLQNLLGKAISLTLRHGWQR